MRVFLAGASGVIGRSLVERLVSAGHEVSGMTSRPENVATIEERGGQAVVCDALDASATRAAVAEARPAVVISQLTRLPKDGYDPRTVDYEPTIRARRDGGRNLIAAAREAGARRFVSQSIAFIYEPSGPMVRDETAPPWTDPPGVFGPAAKATIEHEGDVLEAEGIEGIVLRYGWLYGPGTYYAADGDTAEQTRKRRFRSSVAARGTSPSSTSTTRASATLAALERGAPGIYNVVDDDPAPLREWLPYYAEAVGAKRPMHVPAWLARLVAGSFVAALAGDLRGASNAKAKRELGWRPRYPSWRQGFREALG